LKQYIAIFFLSAYLLSTTQLHELLKLPVLVEHFIEHKQQDPKMNFLEFLCMHYAHGNVRDADYDKDMRLPFKSCNSNINNTISFCTPATDHTFSFTERLYPVVVNKTFFPKDERFYASDYLSFIWQPPRLS